MLQRRFPPEGGRKGGEIHQVKCCNGDCNVTWCILWMPTQHGGSILLGFTQESILPPKIAQLYRYTGTKKGEGTMKVKVCSPKSVAHLVGQGGFWTRADIARGLGRSKTTHVISTIERAARMGLIQKLPGQDAAGRDAWVYTVEVKQEWLPNYKQVYS